MGILNKNKDLIPDTAIYIGRGSKWGNPFKIGQDGTRSDVILKYEQWIKNQSELINCIDELRDVDLVCFCKPKACHGDVLVKIMNMTIEQREQWVSNEIVWSDFYECD